MAGFWHRLAHLLGWWRGDVKVWREDGIIVVGYQFRACGTRVGIHRVAPWVREGRAPEDER